MAVDLHLHSTASDGTLMPAQVVEKAHEIGLKTIALTDHDSVAGINEALKAASIINLEMIAGLEFSSVYKNKDIHILGYFIDCSSTRLLSKLTTLRKARVDRTKIMVEKLEKLGLAIDLDEVYENAVGEAVGRPHVARVLLKNGFVGGIGEAFEKYIGRERPAYVAKYVLEVDQVIDLIHNAKGIASVAHPGHSHVDDEILTDLVDMGLDAIEVWHTDHSKKDRMLYQNMAEQYRLLITGGSDCHGLGKSRGFVIGSLNIPDWIIEPLRKKAVVGRTGPR